VLGRGLISAQPKADRSKLDEGEVIGSEPVIAGGDAPALLDLIEEPLHQVTRPIEMGTEADRVPAVYLRGYVGPSTLFVDVRPDPAGIVATIRQHHRSRAQFDQKHRTELIVVSLARGYRHYSVAYVSNEDTAHVAGAGISRGTFEAPWDWREAQRQGQPQTEPQNQPQAPTPGGNGTAISLCLIKGNIRSKGECMPVRDSAFYFATTHKTKVKFR
jgi:hypothetical protein